MASQQDHHHKGDNDHDPPYMADEEEGPDISLTIITISMEIPTGTFYNPPGVTSGSDASKTIMSGPWDNFKYTPINGYPPWPSDHASSTLTTKVKSTPSPEWDIQTFAPTRVSITTNDVSLSSTSAAGNDIGNQRPGWNGEHKASNRGVVYAAAVIVSIVVLAAIGLIIMFCLRKRKRQNQEVAAAHARVEEMKTQSSYEAQPFIGPLSSLPQYTTMRVELPLTNPTCPQPSYYLARTARTLPASTHLTWSQ